MAETRVRQKHKAIELAEELGSVYRKYAHHTLLDRAIADVRDGFKPVHRRFVFARGDMGLGPSSPHRKCARVVGEVLGKYHPHGDQSVYDALTRMGQAFSQRDVLIDGQGKFGSISLPNVLVNGSSGIAVGFAANLAPHNLGEVCDAAALLCKRWRTRDQVTVEDLMEIVPARTFPLAGSCIVTARIAVETRPHAATRSRLHTQRAMPASCARPACG